MRITALSARLILFPAALLFAAAPADTPYLQIAKLASLISDGQASAALAVFDRKLPRLSVITENLDALTKLDEVLCSIDVVGDKEADNDKSDIHHLDLDWYMTLRSRADAGLTETRRRRVSVTLERLPPKSGSAWLITAISPDNIFDPVFVR